MELQKLDINGLNNVYTLSVVKKEFEKAVNEKWKNQPPMKRYQEKLLANLAVLDVEKEKAIELPQYEKLVGEEKTPVLGVRVEENALQLKEKTLEKAGIKVISSATEIGSQIAKLLLDEKGVKHGSK